ncbi:acyltransferase [Sphingomonas oligophenolica]|uniref:Acyltransferase n=1 Tax=Sphingomonas oligophenolica TaxID=301154 RepID=A0ABU9XZ39_9SPHN
MRRAEIVGVQYLRGIAALAVVVDHASGTAAFSKYFGDSPAWAFTSNGARGVDLFFMISGFIITIVALQGAELAPAMRLGDFFARRFARIVPLMWLAIVSYLLLQLAFRHGVPPLLPYVHAMLLLPGAILPPHIWTLRQELVFYLVFAIAMLTVRPARLVVALWLALPFILIALGMLPHDRGMVQGGIAMIAAPNNLEFGAGMLIGIIWLKRFAHRDLVAPIDPLFLLVVGFVAVVAAISWTSGRLAVPGHVALCSLLFVPLLFYAVHVRCPDGWPRRIGETLGNASYAIYLFHPHAVSGSLGILARLTPWMPRGALVAIVVLIATGFGVAVHLLVEKPLVRYARILLGRSPSPSMTSSGTTGGA